MNQAAAAQIPSASDLREAIARKQLLRYQLAAKAGIHPARLSALLSGRVPLPDALATRIAEAIRIADQR